MTSGLLVKIRTVLFFLANGFPSCIFYFYSISFLISSSRFIASIGVRLLTLVEASFSSRYSIFLFTAGGNTSSPRESVF